LLSPLIIDLIILWPCFRKIKINNHLLFFLCV
jgi:hypothetical protein